MAGTLGVILSGKADLVDGKIKTDQLPSNTGGGESAYEIAVRLGYEGTEEQWIISLRGQDGDGGGLTQSQILTRQL